jgi:PKD repeat protein
MRLAAALLAGALTMVGVSAQATPAQAATGDLGYADSAYGTGPGTDSPTADKPENKLWYAHGTWWADMWNVSAAQHQIYSLNKSTHTWSSTGVTLDSRASTRSDTLYNGTHLFVSSHVIASANNKAVNSKPTQLFRYSWNGSGWSPDAGFPVTIQSYSLESLTIDVDGAGVIWATWTRGGKVYVTSSTTSADGSTVSFLTPWVLTAPGANTSVNADDISAVVSFYGGRMMVLWSNQNDGTMYYAVHLDGAAATTWTGGIASTGALMADDHINLKSLQSDAEGRVFAALKTSRNDAASPVATDPLIQVLTFRPIQGTWSSSVFGQVRDHHTRPILLIDEENQALHVFATGPSTPGQVVYSGTIYEKTAPLANPVFPTGVGTPVIRDVNSADMNNATSTRQAVNSGTGIVVLASNSTTQRYWHMEESLPGGVVQPTASFTAAPASGTAPLPVSFTDTSSGSPTSWSWDFGDGSTSTSQNPSHTYSAAGTYTVRLTVQNTAGSNATTRTVVVSTPTGSAPTAAFTSSPSSGTAPLAVSFTDTSTGAPTSWSWNFGDGGTSTSQNPAHTFTAAGSYPVTLTAQNGSGSDSVSHTVTVNPATTSQVLYRVRAGGEAFAGTPTWTADTAAAPSPYTNAAKAYSVAYASTKVIATTDPSVPPGTPAELFQDFRYDVSKAEPMKWSFPASTAGSYTVKLYFAETWSTNYAVGGRVFNVVAEGSTAIPNLDVWAEVGAKVGLVKTITVPVSDGTLNLDFLPVHDNPMVSAIEIDGPA